MGPLMRDALVVWLKAQHEQATTKLKVISDEEELVQSKSRDIGRLLAAIFAPNPKAGQAVLEDLAIDYLVLAHHPEIDEDAQASWIGLVQLVGLNPSPILADHKDRILKVLWDAAGTPPQVSNKSIGDTDYPRTSAYPLRPIAPPLLLHSSAP